MAQTIKLKRSATADNEPELNQLALGEVAINTTDGKMFIKRSVGGNESIIQVGDTSALLPLSGGTLTGGLSGTTASFSGAVTSTGLNIDTTDPFMSFKESGATKLFIGESSVVGGGGAGFYDFYAVAGLGQRFFTGAAERIRIFSGGNTSIGSSTDLGYKLNVVGNALFRTDSASTSFGNHSSSIRIQNQNTTDNNYAGIVFDGSANAAGAIQFQYTDQSGSYGDICFETRGSGGYKEQLRISSSGAATFASSVSTTLLNITGGSQLGQDFAYFKSNSTSTASLTLRKDSSGADSIDYLQLRSDGNGLLGKITGAGVIHTKGASLDGGVVINEASADVDFRVESNNSSHMIFVDGGNNKIGINNSSPQSLLDVIEANNVKSHVSARYNTSNRKVGFNVNNSNGQGFLASNANQVSGSAAATYDINGRAAKVDFGNGIELMTSASGSAGATIAYVNNLEIDNTASVFNEGGVDLDFRVESDNNTHALFVQGSSGNVSIGESDPDSTLTVKGSGHTNFQVKSNSESTKAFIQTVQDSDVRIGSSTNHPVSFYQNGTERMRINSSGNVGIGTNLPVSSLHVSGNITIDSSSNAPYLDFVENGDTGDSKARIAMDQISGTSGQMLFYTEGSGTLSERMRIDSSGNVGIGTVPQSKLDIDVAVDTSLGLRSQTGVIVAQYTGAPAVGNRAQIGLGYGNAYTNVSIGAVRTSATAYGTDDFIIATKSGTADTAPTERMRIGSTGALILNNSGGDAQMYFGGTSGTSRMYLARSGLDSLLYNVSNGNLRFGTNNQERLRLTSGGNLLVGKTTSSIATAGTAIRGDNPGLINSVRNGVILELNRLSTSGNIIDFFKDGSTVGSIGVSSGTYLTIGTGDTGILFDNAGNRFYPCNASTQANLDNAIDIGASNVRFKDLYLSGTANVGNASFGSNLGQVRVINDASSAPASLSLLGYNNIANNTEYAKLEFAMQESGTGGQVHAKISGIVNGTSENASHLAFYTSSGSVTERARLTSGGDLLVGKTATANTASGVRIATYNGMTQGAVGTGLLDMHDFYRGTEGSLTRVGHIRTTGTSTSYNTSSDQRLKENIADADDSGSKVDAIQVRKFDWKADGTHQDYGMVAQELKAVAPEAVSGDADSDEMMSVDYSKLVPMLIKEIQSLRQRVASLEE